MSENRFFSKYNIGEYSFGCPEVLEWGDQEGMLTIGKFCSIAKDVKILLGGEHRYDWFSTYSFPDFMDDLPDYPVDHRRSKGGIVIGNDVWIGYGATILSGVTIGNGAVVGAKAVIAKDIPPYSIVVGNPARVIKRRFDDDTIKQLNQLAWWDWPIEKIKRNAGAIMSNNLGDLLCRN
ncbi:CatB-related O-acetyltransferase [Mariprofundus ferrooxydans]|uniref:CatB-related O-acetyltransferase n=1 Tax=Mariprofundus ferrooxydans TaxID=314344 RepID=UPI000478065F